MNQKKTPLKWLDDEIEKDNKELQLEKLKLINEIKKYKKDEILPPKPKKLTIWQRIKKVLMG